MQSCLHGIFVLNQEMKIFSPINVVFFYLSLRFYVQIRILNLINNIIQLVDKQLLYNTEGEEIAHACGSPAYARITLMPYKSDPGCMET